MALRHIPTPEMQSMTEDPAGTFLFLASSEASFITGQVINIDGGWVTY